MTRGDWVSIGATLVIGGIGYWISGPKAAIAAVVVGTAIIAAVHFSQRGKEGEELAPTSIKNSLKPTAKDSSNATATATSTGNKIEQHFHIPAPPPNPVEPLRAPVLRISSSVVMEMGKVRPVYLRNDASGTWYEVSGQTNLFGLVVPIYYNPTKSELRTDLYVKAHLVFTETDAGERTIVPAACWIGEYLNHIVFQPGAEERILVAVIGNRGIVALHNRVEQYDYSNETTDGVRLIELSPDPKSVELVLMWSDKTLVHRFDLPRLDSFRPPQI